MKRVSFYTLGCKLNQAETSFLISECDEAGYEIVPFGESCDFCVINTCAVTSRTEQKCRNAIRKMRKNSPDVQIAVIGCYAQKEYAEISQMPGVRFVLGGDEKFDLCAILENEQNGRVVKTSDNLTYRSAAHGDNRARTRAFLKIQDGCNNFCSYCIVPYVRGRSRSDTPANIRDNVLRLVDRGFQEIVFTGVHIGRYGFDLDPEQSLLSLMQQVTTIPGLGRIRLSSLEPMEATADLIAFIADNDNICPHFHIPLQSGDDYILNRMNRDYTRREFEKVIENIATHFKHPGIGTDVIVGFPGETDDRFENTHALIRNLPLTYLHVFSFSSRKGTKAAEFEDTIASVVKKERSALLIETGRKKKRAFYSAAIGRDHRVVFEDKAGSDNMSGFTENYIRVTTKRDLQYLNRIVPVKVTGIEGDNAMVDFC
ncbi:MAG: tRNA (N(6)-L-threonylcarbamoyladenosine(37)-C(2))-methylthiotransferase MtaB [candidate division KSB1 bacterium]|jgi:threonylcarbamoyladenosine tRNA methylthiotransferase MtaB|nr:tRNA (N(6)-L-threonylcarbamoyladenosine(37)-C(2))-methylthiotransferase MtaB [candidate division KSB1 bacterium]